MLVLWTDAMTAGADFLQRRLEILRLQVSGEYRSGRLYTGHASRGFHRRSSTFEHRRQTAQCNHISQNTRHERF
jgi:hypothetical protein